MKKGGLKMTQEQLKKQISAEAVASIKDMYGLGRLDSFAKSLNLVEDKRCNECGSKLTLPDEIKYGICRGCGSSESSEDKWITDAYMEGGDQ